jgi:hypothetical protein
MQSVFKNKVVWPKKTREVHFVTSLNIFLVAFLYNSDFHYFGQCFAAN